MLSISERPTTFAQVIGQDFAVSSLKAVAKAESVVARAVVLQGAWGCGKSTLSRIFGKAINCSQFRKTGDVCNVCESCVESSLENSSLYMEYDSSRISSVDSIKSIIDKAMISSGSGKRKVIALDEVHALSKASFTALLKTLEEGSDQVIWVFPTTENLMPTIMSRSWVVPLSTVAPSLLEEYISSLSKRQNININDVQIKVLVAKAKGHVRDALQYLDQFALVGESALLTPYEDIKRLLYKILKKESVDEELLNLSKFTVSSIKDAINLLLRNIFMKEGSFESKLNELGLANKLFKFFYLPEVRLALSDEYGSILVFRSLVLYFR